MNNTPEKYVDRLLEITNKKYNHLQVILSLTKEQAQNIMEDRIEQLEKIVSDKQSKIDEINKFDEEFTVYFHRLKSELKVKSLDELQNKNIQGIKELKEAVGNVTKLLGEIFEIEKSNSEGVKKLLGHLGDEIRKINDAKKVNSAYKTGSAQLPSYFIDKKK